MNGMGRTVSKILILLICFHLIHAPVARAKASVHALMFASALAAPMVLKQCKKKISAWIFLGSAGFLLATELMNSKKHKEDSKAVEVDLKSQDASEKQIEALEAAAAAADKAADAADKRSKNFKIAAMGFAAAAAAALVEAFLSKPGTAPGKTPPCIRPNNGICDTGACQASGGGSVPTELEVTKVENGWRNWFKNFGEWWLPSAHAMNMKSLVAPAMGIGAWFLIKKRFPKAQAFINKTLNNGFKRAAVFGAFAGLAFLASRSTKKDAEELRKRAKTYRDLAAKMRRRLGLKAGMNTGTLQYIPPVQKSSTSGKGDGDTDLVKVDASCVVGKTGQFPQVDENCLCKKDNSCKKTTLPKANIPELPNAATSLNEASNLLKDYSDKTYSGDLSGAAQVSDASISRAAAKVNRLKKKLWDLSKKHAQKNGEKFVEGSLLEKAYTSRLKKAINSDFRGLSSKDKADLAAMAPTFMNDPTSKPISSSSKKSESSSVVQATTGGKGGRQGVALSDFDLIEDNAEKVALDEQGGEGNVTVQADFADKSVNSNREQSIWKVISGRYYKLYFGINE